MARGWPRGVRRHPTDIDMAALMRAVRRTMEQRGRSVNATAKTMHVSARTLHRWLSGEDYPRDDRVGYLISFCGWLEPAAAILPGIPGRVEPWDGRESSHPLDFVAHRTSDHTRLVDAAIMCHEDED